MIRQTLGGMPGPNDLATQPADPPVPAVCPTCSAEHTDEGAECDACVTWRRLIEEADVDDVVRLLRVLEDDAAWHRRRLKAHRCPEVDRG